MLGSSYNFRAIHNNNWGAKKFNFPSEWVNFDWIQENLISQLNQMRKLSSEKNFVGCELKFSFLHLKFNRQQFMANKLLIRIISQ